MNHSEPFCGTAWNSFQYFVTDNSVRLYSLLLLLVMGTILNTLVVIIFAKNIILSSNLLFTSLAISDAIFLFLGYPRLWIAISHHTHDSLNQGLLYSKAERVIDYYLSTCQKIFYHISVYQTMMLAIWRYIAITYPLKEKILCNWKTTFICIIMIYVLCTLCYIPDLLGLNIPSVQVTLCGKAVKIRNTTDKVQKKENVPFFQPFNDLIYIVILKIVPCSIIAICTVKFVQVLQKSKTRRKQIVAKSNGDLAETEKQMNRTTKMVLGITIFYLFMNALMTIGRILVVIYGAEFKKDCFPGIKCANNFLAICYATIPLIVYYITSRQFRDNFKSLIFSGRRTLLLFSIKNSGSFDIKTSTSTLPSMCDSSASICRVTYLNNDVID